MEAVGDFKLGIKREKCDKMTNYQLKLDKIIKENNTNNQRPSLLLHSCCAPCSSYVLEYLLNSFEITVFYYNPNIFPESEMMLRVKEQEKLIDEINQGAFGRMKAENQSIDSDKPKTGKQSIHKEEPKAKEVTFIQGPYEKEKFYHLAQGLEKERERGERCRKCYKLRLEKTAKFAKEQGFDYFTTTLSISPLKDADLMNQIGSQLEEEVQVKWLPSDFKKKNGYRRSVELSKQFGLYRQNYCGCEFSLVNR